MTNIKENNPECRRCGLLKSTIDHSLNIYGKEIVAMCADGHDFEVQDRVQDSVQVEPPTEGWEVRFDKVFGGKYDAYVLESIKDKIKAFIKSLLSQSKEEARQNFEPTDEELEESAWFKAKKLMIEEEAREQGLKIGYGDGLRDGKEAIDKVLNLLT